MLFRAGGSSLNPGTKEQRMDPIVFIYRADAGSASPLCSWTLCCLMPLRAGGLGWTGWTPWFYGTTPYTLFFIFCFPLPDFSRFSYPSGDFFPVFEYVRLAYMTVGFALSVIFRCSGWRSGGRWQRFSASVLPCVFRLSRDAVWLFHPDRLSASAVSDHIKIT